MGKPRNKQFQNYFFLLIGCLAIVFLIFLITAKQFGNSIDELILYDYANANLNSYKNLLFNLSFDPTIGMDNLNYYGTAYLILADVLVKGINSIFPGLDYFNIWHTINFAQFLAGAIFLFFLCRRFVSEKAAFFAALLYVFQPLLWGHGVMNPKDIPFMTFFLATVTLGLQMVDRISEPNFPIHPQTMGLRWRQIPRRVRFLLSTIVLLLLFCLVDRITSNMLTRPVINFFLEQAKTSPSNTLLNYLFLHFARSAEQIPIAAYIEKAVRFCNMVEFIFLAGIGLSSLTLVLIKGSAKIRWTLLAGIVLGLTTSIRVLGPAAAGIVFLYLILDKKKFPVRYILIYLFSSLGASYVFWPYLWPNPLGNFIDCFIYMSNFPWTNMIRFEGVDYLAHDLPWYYLPKLIGIQFTMPLLLLSLAGLWLSIKQNYKSVIRRPAKLLVILWFLIPLAAAIIFNPTMYDNFRQFFFIVPPLFVLAAEAIEWMAVRIKSQKLFSSLAVCLLLPGIIAGAWLHPYEYIYYNALVGWTGQVGRDYATDYWGTSMCEAGSYITSIAGSNTQIAFTDAFLSNTFSHCANRKFSLIVEPVEFTQIYPDYSVVNTRNDDDIYYFRNMREFKIIGRGKTVFSVIKKRQ
jgi:hypothetical protein